VAAAGGIGTRRWWSLTTMSPSRAVGAGFGATRKVTSPLPWPETGDRSDIHGTAAAADHEHSGVVLTVTTPVPPSGPMVDDDDASDTWHLTGVGPVDVLEFEPHPAAAPAAARMTPTSARHRPGRVRICS
jgi:hypothetical protein